MIEIHELKEYSGAKKTSDENAAIEYCRIGDVVDMQSGVAFKKSEYSNDGVRLFQIANVSFNYIKWEEVEHLPEDYVSKYPELLLEEGNIVMALNRPLLNDHLKIALIKKSDTPSILYQRVGRFKFLIEHNPRYFLYFLQSPLFIKWLKEQLQGVNIPFINKSKLLGYNKYPKHTVDEQTQIVSRIEELFSELDKGIEELKTAKQQLKVYRQAVLKWAFEGKLTNTENTIRIIAFGDIIKVVSGNTPKGLDSCKNSGMYQFYKVSDMNFEGNEIEMRTAKLSLTDKEVENLKIKIYPKGTVIFPKRGGAILTNKKRILAFDSSFDLNIMGALPNESVNSKYLFYWFQKLDLSKIFDGSNVPQINNKNIEPLQFQLCSIEQQQQIVQEIESRLSVCDKIEETIKDSLKQAGALRQSILKKAFEGKNI